MKEDAENPEVVNCMDLLIPHIGELIGSSVREDDYEKLVKRMEEKNIDRAPLEWYLDLRKNGTWRHREESRETFTLAQGCGGGGGGVEGLLHCQGAGQLHQTLGDQHE